MAYPVGLSTKDVSFGSAAVIESGSPVGMQVTIKASRNLLYRPTGSPLLTRSTQFVSAEDGNGTISLPVCDSPNMGTGNGASIVLGPGEVTHTYTATIRYFIGGETLGSITRGPFVLLSSSPPVSDIDDLLIGDAAPSPAEVAALQVLGQRIAALEAALADFDPLGGTRTIIADQIADASSVGKAVVRADSADQARAAIGAGTSDLTLGTTSTTAKPGDYTPAAADIVGFTEAAQDAVAAMFAPGSGVTLAYNDASNTFTISVDGQPDSGSTIPITIPFTVGS